jgi:hypothetical protein
MGVFVVLLFGLRIRKTNTVYSIQVDLKCQVDPVSPSLPGEVEMSPKSPC